MLRAVKPAHLLLAAVLAAALATPGQSSYGRAGDAGAFVGDFEVRPPGWQQFDWLQYEEERPLAESFALVESPVRQGTRAVRTTAHHGYSRLGFSESTQLAWGGGEREGDDYWYAWSTLFPRDWIAPYKWGIFAEWHANLPTSPLIGFGARHDRAELRLLTGLTNAGTNAAAVDRVVPLLPTLSKGRWNDFVMHVRWSQRNRGLVEVFHRVEGTQALRKLVSFRDVPTFQVTRDGRGLGTYVLLGLYRGSYCPQPTQLGCTSPLGVQPPGTVFHDGFVRERTFAAAVARAFPGSPPELPAAATRAVQQEGWSLEPLSLRSAKPAKAQTDRGCNRCRIVSRGGRVVARIADAEDDRDTSVLAYRLRQRNAVVVRYRPTVLARRITGRLVVAQVRDVKERALVELYLDSRGTFRLYSPRGALRERGFDVDTGIAGTPGAEPLSMELRLIPNEVLFGAFGQLIVRFTNLDGPRKGARLTTLLGIERYEGRQGEGAISVVYDELVVGSS